MEVLPVDGRALILPALIPSISSFETQLGPVDALRLQLTLQEPVSLVSAFDLVADTDGNLAKMCRSYRERGVLFLDSGGYETSRWGRYGAKFDWSVESFIAAAQPDLYDFAFSFDEFPNLSQDTWEIYADRLEELLHRQRSIPDHKLIPVIHLRERTTKERFSDDDAVKLAKNIAERRTCTFIAVTERELGDGLSARVALARRIKDAISEDTDTKLHILGCGNPLSFAAFAEAGVDCCDGLEWCRTYCSSDMRLYHFQHSKNIGKLLEPVSFQAQFLLESASDYYVQTAVVNLNNFAKIVESIQQDPKMAIRIIEDTYADRVKI